MTELSTVLEVVDKISTLLLLILALVGGAKRWWVFGHHYVDKCLECEQWRTLCLSGHDLNKQTVQTLTTVVRP